MTKEKIAKTVSVRLPEQIISILKAEVELSSTTQSDVVRRALILYRRAHGGVLVPLSADHRAALIEISDIKRIPYEHLLTSWIVEAIESEKKGRKYLTCSVNKKVKFTPTSMFPEKKTEYVTSQSNHSVPYHVN